MCRRVEHLEFGIALTDRVESGAKLFDRLVVGVKQFSLCEERMEEGVLKLAFYDLAELSPGNEECVDIDAVRVEGARRVFDLTIIYGDEN